MTSSGSVAAIGEPTRGRTGGRLSRVVRAHAVGAVAGQMTQALTSFILQILAARLLGAAGLGRFAVLYSLVVLGTAVSTGLVGDSLTILDRQRAVIRAGLQRWTGVTAVFVGFAAAVGTDVARVTDQRGAVIFGAAVAVFLVEDVLRRLLMASMRFWSLAVVDLSALVVGVAIIAASAVTGSVTLESFLLALLIGQAVAALVAVPLLPREERHLAPWRDADMGSVFRFGFWRGAQQSIRPTMLTAARVLIVLAAGAAVFGQLEAARVYMAPAMLIVQGIGAYLMSSYARLRDTPLRALLVRADRTSRIMFGAALGLGALATLTVPVIGPLITAGRYELQPLAVFGWAVYAASAAAIMPFSSLAAVRGRQSLIVLLRVMDSLLSVSVLALILFLFDVGVGWAPFALSVGSFAGGIVIRNWVLKPLLSEGT